ncbi:MAG TPA: flavodoxin domain-containing protein [Jiangellaceae bacterium]
MKAVIVVETCFGNTSSVAEAITEGLRSAGADVEIMPADTAPSRLSADLMLVGAPTHNLGLPSADTRRQAVQKGAATLPAAGVKEWIAGVQTLDGRVVTFSTTTGGRFAGSAGKAIVKALKQRRVRAERGEDFRVTGTPGPLVAGELDRAREWGRTLRG